MDVPMSTVLLENVISYSRCFHTQSLVGDVLDTDCESGLQMFALLEMKRNTGGQRWNDMHISECQRRSKTLTGKFWLYSHTIFQKEIFTLAT